MRATIFLIIVLVALPSSAFPQVRTCPPGFNDTPAMPTHLEQANVISMPLQKVFSAGQRIFVTNFNACDGAGRPGTTGAGAERTPDPSLGPRFTRVSAPDANSCAGCHAQPQPGGAGDFVANVFVLAQSQNPVSRVILNDDFSNTWLEGNTLGMFGSGAVELLGREMTSDLQNLEANGVAHAKNTSQNVLVSLRSKGVVFGSLIGHPDGSVDTTGVEGVDPDLVIKPFSRKGVFRSVREFTVTAYNQHHGMQTVERFGEGTDQDGVTDELTVGDITAVSVVQEALPVPVMILLPGSEEQAAVARGSSLFDKIGCVGCHVPQLQLKNTTFCDPDPQNPSNSFHNDGQSPPQIGPPPHHPYTFL
jgi:hypothetical protein